MYLPYKKFTIIIGCLLAIEGRAEPLSEKVTQLKAVSISVNKMAEDPLTSSSSVSVITAEDIQKKGINSIEDITKVLPNAFNGSAYSGSTDWNYRGLNSSQFKGNNPVIIYVDGVPQIDRHTMFVDMKQVERIEIVHGPSGTVYGRSAIGGVINIITKRAEAQLSGELSLEMGEHGLLNGNLFLSGPIIKDKLLAKLAFGAEKYDGVLEFKDRQVSDENDDRNSGHNYSGEFIFFPNDVSSVTFQLNHNEEKSGYGLAELLQLENINSSQRSEELDYNTKTQRENDTDSQSIKFDYEFEQWRLESQFVHRDATYNGLYECDYSSLSRLECHQDIAIKDLNGEVRMVSDEEDVKWVIGLYVGTTEKDIDGNGYSIDGYDLASSNGEQDENTMALFGQLIYPLTEQINLTVGARLQQQTYKTDTHYYAAANPSYSLPETRVDTKDSTRENAFLPKLGISYSLNQQNTLFGSYSRGFLGGGYNDFQVTIKGPEDAYYKPQINDSFELGYKGQFQSLQVSVGFFYMDIKDIHTYTAEAGSLFTAGNLEGATSKGIEIQAKYMFKKNWSWDISLGYTSAKYKDGSLFNGIDAGAKSVEKTPRGTATIGTDFSQNNWTVRIEAIYRGDYYFNFQNDKEINGFTQLNTRLAWDSKNLGVYAYLNNITDVAGVTAAFDTSSLVGEGTVQRSLIKSRHAGIGVNYRF